MAPRLPGGLGPAINEGRIILKITSFFLHHSIKKFSA